MKKPPSSWNEPQVYVVLRTFFSDKFLDNIAEVLAPNGKTHQFYEDYMERVE